MISKFYKHQHIWILLNDQILYSRIVCIIFVNIRKQDFKVTFMCLRDRKCVCIEMSKLIRIDKKQDAKKQSKQASKSLPPRKRCSQFSCLTVFIYIDKRKN